MKSDEWDQGVSGESREGGGAREEGYEDWRGTRIGGEASKFQGASDHERARTWIMQFACQGLHCY